MKQFIQIGNNFRLTSISGSELFQVWKQISGGTYRKCNLNLSILNNIDFIKTQYILHMIINQFVGKKFNTCGYIVSSKEFKQFDDISIDNILKIASDIKSDETIIIFYKTK